MVTYFDEEDLISFAQYMISDQRKESVKAHPEITNNDQRKEFLKVVTPFDYNNWIRLRFLSQQDEDSTNSEQIETNE